MSFFEIFLSPLNLLFLILIVGLALGRIRIYRISLGIAGVLFVSIFTGILMNNLIPSESAEIMSHAQNTLNTFSKLGSSLFISVIGLQTGLSLKNNRKSSFISFITGSAMSIISVGVMCIISALDNTINYHSLLGILCGALTSTPGLSSVCELIGTNSEEAIWGYGCSYLCGVLFVVLFVQFFKPKTAYQKTSTSPQSITTSKIYPELLLICITAFLGNVLGNVCLPIINVSIGNSACSLLFGLILGYIVQKTLAKVHTSDQVLNTLKNWGLALFFVGTGFVTGIKPATFNVKTIIYGGLITLSSLLCGLLLCKIIFKRSALNTSCVIAGGMTSSPAYGSLSTNVTEVSINHFSFAYFGALISLITAIQIIVR